MAIVSDTDHSLLARFGTLESIRLDSSWKLSRNYHWDIDREKRQR